MMLIHQGNVKRHLQGHYVIEKAYDQLTLIQLR